MFDKNLKKKLKELDNCVENQNEFNQLIADLINNLDFEDSDSKEQEEKKETSKEDASSSDKNQDENSSTQKDEDKSNDSDVNVIDANFESFSENKDVDDKETKEVVGDPNLSKKNQKNLLKE